MKKPKTYTPCQKCNSTGKVDFQRDGGICYNCEGKGYEGLATPIHEKYSEYLHSIRAIEVEREKAGRWIAKQLLGTGKNDFGRYELEMLSEKHNGIYKIPKFLADLFLTPYVCHIHEADKNRANTQYRITTGDVTVVEVAQSKIQISINKSIGEWQKMDTRKFL